MSVKKSILVFGVPMLGLVMILGAMLLLREPSSVWSSRPKPEATGGNSHENEAPAKTLPKEPWEQTIYHLRDAVDRQLAGKNPDKSRGSAADQVKKIGPALFQRAMQTLKSSDEKALLKLELLNLLAEANLHGTNEFLLMVFADRSLGEQFRSLALLRIADHSGDAYFDTVRMSFLEERDYPARHLLVKAIANCKRPEAVQLLMEATRPEEMPAVRIQGLEGLAARIEEEGVLENVQGVFYRDADENVRLATLNAIGRSRLSSVDTFLREIAENPESSSRLRSAAQDWLKRRGK